MISTREGIVRNYVGVNSLILSWEQMNAGGGGGTMELEVPTGGREGRRRSQEFRDLCLKFGEKEEDGTKEDVRRKPGRDPNINVICSFWKCVRHFAFSDLYI